MRERVSIASYEATRLRRIGHRTRVVRITLVAAAVALGLAAAAAARDLEVRERGPLPTSGAGVVILDLSVSIEDDNYASVRKAVEAIAETNSPIGLVIFSDAPYELLPPGTPGRELRPILRLLAARGRANPWTRSFRSGTKISEAIKLARTMLERDEVRKGSIVLVSDLETAPDDYEALARELEIVRRGRIPLRVFALAPSSDARTLFEGVLGPDALAPPPKIGERQRDGAGDLRGVLPISLLVFAGLCLVALGAHERYAARLRLPSRAREQAA